MKSSLLRTDEELSCIYRRHVKTVYRVCFMYIKNKHDTEDMVQSTFIKLMKNKIDFENEEHEKAWLIRTAINTCKDHFRNRWNKTVSINKVAKLAVEEPFDIDDTLEKVLALPPKYKTAIYMYYYEGYSTVEIGEILKKKASTIRGHLFTGRKLLRMDMEGDIR
ncbi:MAG TPA: RNA polymerase sigma factor [Bacillota bacterium]|nr:RNA polymerase sigma factor [Bacillota bacterium]